MAMTRLGGAGVAVGGVGHVVVVVWGRGARFRRYGSDDYGYTPSGPMTTEDATGVGQTVTTVMGPSALFIPSTTTGALGGLGI